LGFLDPGELISTTRRRTTVEWLFGTRLPGPKRPKMIITDSLEYTRDIGYC